MYLVKGHESTFGSHAFSENFDGPRGWRLPQLRKNGRFRGNQHFFHTIAEIREKNVNITEIIILHGMYLVLLESSLKM